MPLHDAQADDGKLRVVYEKVHVKPAPDVETRGEQIGTRTQTSRASITASTASL
jgi:hypothetical protein